jgi:F0F1-type ATP synthase membrane subunit b/b'
MANDSKAKFETLKEDTKDVVDEAKHRAQAAIHKTQADIDAAKRDIRHSAENKDDKV